MDEPLKTTETFKELSREACRQSRWIRITDRAYESTRWQRTPAHDAVLNQVIKDHVSLYYIT